MVKLKFYSTTSCFFIYMLLSLLNERQLFEKNKNIHRSFIKLNI